MDAPASTQRSTPFGRMRESPAYRGTVSPVVPAAGAAPRRGATIANPAARPAPVMRDASLSPVMVPPPAEFFAPEGTVIASRVRPDALGLARLLERVERPHGRQPYLVIWVPGGCDERVHRALVTQRAQHLGRALAQLRHRVGQRADQAVRGPKILGRAERV